MAELGISGRLPILRLGVITPLDTALIQRHINSCRQVLVLDPTGLGVAYAVRDTVANVKLPAQDDDAQAKPVANVQVIPLNTNAGPGGVIQAIKPWLESHPTLPRELVTSGLKRVQHANTYDQQHHALPERGKSPPPGSSLVDVSVVLGRLRRDLADAQHMLEQHRTGPVDLSTTPRSCYCRDGSRLRAGWTAMAVSPEPPPPA